jgi:pimeloyl-ACP methyl ester carboxylesterase
MLTTQAITPVEIPAGSITLQADLTIPERAEGLIIFAHGSGSSRFSTRNRHVARILNRQEYATLLLDLLTPREEAIDSYTRKYRFDIDRLARRVCAAVDWAGARAVLRDLPQGCFGASTGAAAALVAAADRPASVGAVVSRGGRPDLAGTALTRVEAPTLLIVGALDDAVIELNQAAMAKMSGVVELEIVPGATHLFEEPGTLDRVAEIAVGWFRRYLSSPGATSSVVPIGEWCSFLESFSRRHRGWLTSVTTLAPRGPSHQLITDRPLDAIQVLRDAGRITALEMRFSDGIAPRSVVALAPHLLRVDETPRGTERGLDVEDRCGLHTQVRFRAAVRPEEVDGVAATEL